MAGRDRGVAAEAKRAGGDGLLLTGDQTNFMGSMTTGNASSFVTGNAVTKQGLQRRYRSFRGKPDITLSNTFNNTQRGFVESGLLSDSLQTIRSRWRDRHSGVIAESVPKRTLRLRHDPRLDFTVER